MAMDEINKKYAELKCTKLCIERAMEKFEGTNNIENYLSYDVLHIAHECVVSYMDRFVNKDWN